MTRSRTPSLEKAIDAVTLVASNPPRPARQNAANQNVLIISTPKLNRERDQSTLIWCCAQLEMSFAAQGERCWLMCRWCEAKTVIASEAIQGHKEKSGLLRFARNDE